MKKAGSILLFACFILVIFLLKPRQDLVFGAINESQYIRLFENGREFELGIDDNKFYAGTYTISRDTVYLLYQERVELSGTSLYVQQTKNSTALPAKLYITDSDSQIESCNDGLFSAEIFLDNRQESSIPAPVNNRVLDGQTALIKASGGIGPSVLLQQ